MATVDDTKPDALEQYECAANTSNLKCEGRSRGAVDYLIAGGWAPSRIGMALIRLHSAYDSSEKPERQEALTIKEWKKIVHTEEAARRAHAEQREKFEGWYRTEVERLLGRLQAFPTVREQLTIQADKWNMAEPQTKAVATIRYWLSQHCPACGGTRWQLMPGTQRQSDKPCMACIGGGYVTPPFNQEGRRLANYLDKCVQAAHTALRRNLSNMRISRLEREEREKPDERC